MTEQGRVDLERMRAVYERERAAMERAAADQRDRLVRAQASIDRDCHMVGRFRPADKLGLEGPGGAFEAVAVVLEVRSPASAERVGELVAHAERACHSAQSLRVAVPVRLLARLNGNDLWL